MKGDWPMGDWSTAAAAAAIGPTAGTLTISLTEGEEE